MKKSLKVDTSNVQISDVSELRENDVIETLKVEEEKPEARVSGENTNKSLKIKASFKSNPEPKISPIKNVTSNKTITESDKNLKFEVKATKPAKLEYWDKK